MCYLLNSRVVKFKKIYLKKFSFGTLNHKIYLIESINLILSKTNYNDKCNTAGILFPSGQIFALSRN